MTTSVLINTVTSIYTWFNSALNPSNPIDQSGIKKYFTPDFTTIYNNEVTITDHASLLQHVMDVRNGDTRVFFNLPFIETIISEDHKKCVVHYSVTFTHIDGHTTSKQIIAIYHFTADGRVSRLNIVSNDTQ